MTTIKGYQSFDIIISDICQFVNKKHFLISFLENSKKSFIFSEIYDILFKFIERNFWIV